MAFTLSISTNPLVNRYADPDDLIDTIAGRIGIRDIQLTHEFINPGWPAELIAAMTKRVHKAMARTGVRATSMMTGPYGRLNHFGHPDPEVRRYYLSWFKTLCSISSEIGSPAIGTQFAIFTHRDYDDPARRAEMMKIALDCWGELAEHGKRVGQIYLFWEPMSVGREFGHTIAQTKALQALLDTQGYAIPVEMMIDIDHGDVTSPDPSDIDPYAWARTFPTQSRIIHIKQSSMNKGGHWPFTAQYNKDGRITPEKLLAAIKRGGGGNNEICLELSFREREPVDRQVAEMIRESVDYWAPHVDSGRTDLPGFRG
jgi:D-erythrulose 1-phosphate 3-epimerase